MNYQELPRISEQVVSVPPPEGVAYAFDAQENTNLLLLEILAELKSIRYKLYEDSLSVYVTNHNDI